MVYSPQHVYMSLQWAQIDISISLMCRQLRSTVMYMLPSMTWSHLTGNINTTHVVSSKNWRKPHKAREKEGAERFFFLSSFSSAFLSPYGSHLSGGGLSDINNRLWKNRRREGDACFLPEGQDLQRPCVLHGKMGRKLHRQEKERQREMDWRNDWGREKEEMQTAWKWSGRYVVWRTYWLLTKQKSERRKKKRKKKKVWLIDWSGRHGHDKPGRKKWVKERGRRGGGFLWKGDVVQGEEHFSSLCLLIFIWIQLVPNHEDNTKPRFLKTSPLSIPIFTPPHTHPHPLFHSCHVSGSVAVCSV